MRTILVDSNGWPLPSAGVSVGWARPVAGTHVGLTQYGETVLIVTVDTMAPVVQMDLTIAAIQPVEEQGT